MPYDQDSVDKLPTRTEIISFAVGLLRSVLREKLRRRLSPVLDDQEEGLGELLKLMVRECPTELQRLRALEIEAMGDLRMPDAEVAMGAFFVHEIELALAANDSRLGAAGHEARGQEVAEIAVGALRSDRRDDNVAGLDLLGCDMHHPIVPRVQENGHRRSGDERARIDRTHVRLHQPDAAHRLMHGRDAVASERLDGGAFRALDLAPDDAEFGHHLSSRPRVLRHAETRIEPWTS